MFQNMPNQYQRQQMPAFNSPFGTGNGGGGYMGAPIQQQRFSLGQHMMGGSDPQFGYGMGQPMGRNSIQQQAPTIVNYFYRRQQPSYQPPPPMASQIINMDDWMQGGPPQTGYYGGSYQGGGIGQGYGNNGYQGGMGQGYYDPSSGFPGLDGNMFASTVSPFGQGSARGMQQTPFGYDGGMNAGNNALASQLAQIQESQQAMMVAMTVLLMGFQALMVMNQQKPSPPKPPVVKPPTTPTTGPGTTTPGSTTPGSTTPAATSNANQLLQLIQSFMDDNATATPNFGTGNTTTTTISSGTVHQNPGTGGTSTGSGTTGSSTGDPHYAGFRGNHFDFQGDDLTNQLVDLNGDGQLNWGDEGEVYTTISSRTMEFNARFGTWSEASGTDVTVQTQGAFRIGGKAVDGRSIPETRIFVDADGELKMNGSTLNLAVGASSDTFDTGLLDQAGNRVLGKVTRTAEDKYAINTGEYIVTADLKTAANGRSYINFHYEITNLGNLVDGRDTGLMGETGRADYANANGVMDRNGDGTVTDAERQAFYRGDGVLMNAGNQYKVAGNNIWGTSNVSVFGAGIEGQRVYGNLANTSGDSN